MTFFRSAAALILSTAAASAQSWYGEFGQGNTSAGIDAGGVLLEVNCASNANLGANDMYLFVGGTQITGPVVFQIGRWAPITLDFGTTGFRADTATALEDFATLIDLLRRGNTAELTTSAGVVPIPLRGSSRALGTCDVDALRAAAATLPAEPAPQEEAPAEVVEPEAAETTEPEPVTPQAEPAAPDPEEAATAPEPQPDPEPAPEPEPVDQPDPNTETAEPEQPKVAPDEQTATPEPQPAPEVPTEDPGRLTPIQQIETALTRLGYDAGPADGQIDEQLNVAIATWQRDTGREITGGLLDDEFQALLLEAEAAQ